MDKVRYEEIWEETIKMQALVEMLAKTELKELTEMGTNKTLKAFAELGFDESQAYIALSLIGRVYEEKTMAMARAAMAGPAHIVVGEPNP